MTDRAPGEVETVARACNAEGARQMGHPEDWDDLDEEAREDWRRFARVALDAVRGRSRDDTVAWLTEWRDGIDVYDPATQSIYDVLNAVLARFGGAGRPETQDR